MGLPLSLVGVAMAVLVLVAVLCWFKCWWWCCGGYSILSVVTGRSSDGNGGPTGLYSLCNLNLKKRRLGRGRSLCVLW